MKFRVIKEHGLYYVQHKWLFWWIPVSQSDFEYDERMSTPFCTLADAVKFINELVPIKRPNVVWIRNE